MAEFLEDPSVLTKDKLKSELTANNVTLPSGEHKKEVYVQLYRKTLTVLNKKSSPPDTFSSDEELPAPVSNKSRSGRKATRKTDKPASEEVEVTDLTDEGLKDQLMKHGIDAGPIVASTRKVYENKLTKLLDQSALEMTPSLPETASALTEASKADSPQNGNTHSDHYSDKEDEPVPIVEKPVRSRGKTPVTLRTSSRRHSKVEGKQAAGDQTPKKSAENVVEDILANELSTPIGIGATCRRPIRGAAGRPVKPGDYWLDESLLHNVLTKSHSEGLSNAAGPGKTPARRGFVSVLLRLLVLIVVAGSIYYAYENLDTEQINSLKGLLDRVATPLGIGSESAAKSGGK
ncbi:thymopoietin b [Hypomesus transpacificus]|uniref:thymopoietin b n=1 Tax=Hypomesus transpacificus TaxID=137520 RepID=UPI001F0731CB|nr:thymopoietin b [Hypomesus transpacificus]